MHANSNSTVERFDYKDTFLNAQHLAESFPEATSFEFTGADGVSVSFPASAVGVDVALLGTLPPPPYVVDIVSGNTTAASTGSTDTKSTPSPRKTKGKGKKMTKAAAAASAATAPSCTATAAAAATVVVKVTSYQNSTRGPYPTDKVPINRVQFTPTQVEAIRSGLHSVSINTVHTVLPTVQYCSALFCYVFALVCNVRK